MAKMLWELKAPLAIAKAKEDMGLNNIFKYLRYYRMYIDRVRWSYKDIDLTNRIENILFWRGKVALVTDLAYDQIIVCEIDTETRDPNGTLVNVDVSAENGYKRKNLEVGKDVVILYADQTHFAPVLYIWAIANEIIVREDIIDTQDNMLRKPIIVAGEGAKLDNAMTTMQNVLSSVAWFNYNPKNKGGENILSPTGLEVLNLQLGNAYKGKELWESRGKFEELIKDYLGYNSVNNEKKERMIQAEVSQSESICDTFYKSAMKMKDECVKQVKDILGKELKLEKMLEKEKEVQDNGQENKMGNAN